MIFSVFSILTLLIVNLISAANFSANCSDFLPLDIVFIIDSSGSLYDVNFTKWQQELNFVKSIVNNSLSSDSRVGLINFSGCSNKFNLTQCIQRYNKLKTEFTLSEFGFPNNLELVHNRISSMGPNDFNHGFTWTEEALQIALQQFKDDSSSLPLHLNHNRNKIIILITDGKPYPATHEPCISDIQYKSPTLMQLNTLDVSIIQILVGINNTDDIYTQYFVCMANDCVTKPNMNTNISNSNSNSSEVTTCNDILTVTDFDKLATLAPDITEIICDIAVEWDDIIFSDSNETYNDSYDGNNTFMPTHFKIPDHKPPNILYKDHGDKDDSYLLVPYNSIIITTILFAIIQSITFIL